MSLDRKAPKLEPYTETLMSYPYELSPTYEQIRTSPPNFPDQNLNSEYQDSQLKTFSPDQMVEEAAKKRENRLARVQMFYLTEMNKNMSEILDLYIYIINGQWLTILKLILKMKNREAARECRRKKKEYIKVNSRKTEGVATFM